MHAARVRLLLQLAEVLRLEAVLPTKATEDVPLLGRCLVPKQGAFVQFRSKAPCLVPKQGAFVQFRSLFIARDEWGRQ